MSAYPRDCQSPEDRRLFNEQRFHGYMAVLELFRDYGRPFPPPAVVPVPALWYAELIAYLGKPRTVEDEHLIVMRLIRSTRASFRKYSGSENFTIEPPPPWEPPRLLFPRDQPAAPADPSADN